VTGACCIRVRGVVQGVGLRPFVYRLAHQNALAGWVLNAGEGVEIHVEGAQEQLHSFVLELSEQAPAAASIAAIEIEDATPSGLSEFTIRESDQGGVRTAPISPDLAVCARCLSELFDPEDPRFGYPYINCTDCGPRYSIITALPYDRASTTMAAWPMDAACAAEYNDPLSRRFHAEPVACPRCGPGYVLRFEHEVIDDGAVVLRRAAELLRDGRILAVKGIGGYHLACDARNARAVVALRERKFRKEKPFAVMARDLLTARWWAELTPAAEALLQSRARPIVLVPARHQLPGVSPENDELGMMLPYTPLHHLLFAEGAPELLVMTSANRSSEPIAYLDDVAQQRLADIADAFLVGQRAIARRVEDSVARASAQGAIIVRRARGYAPGKVATLPIREPVLALGGDLKSAVTLVVEGQAFVSQHIGDLEQYEAHRAFDETIRDLLRMYEVPVSEVCVVRDIHPQYRSSTHASLLGARRVLAVQHHRAHLASVLGEREAWEERVLGVALDGTGYGDDGTIWGGELFVGSLHTGFQRVGHLRPAALVGGDAAARFPEQAAVGFLKQLAGYPDVRDRNVAPADFTRAPFHLGDRYRKACHIVESGTRVFATTSMGRLFDCVAALLGFTRAITFEGQAAIWLEQLARRSTASEVYAFPFDGRELDFRPLLRAVIDARLLAHDPCDIARGFHLGLVHGLSSALAVLADAHAVSTVVASGGVMQNELVRQELDARLAARSLTLWTNRAVPANDGGLSFGQAVLAAFDHSTRRK